MTLIGIDTALESKLSIKKADFAILYTNQSNLPELKAECEEYFVPYVIICRVLPALMRGHAEQATYYNFDAPVALYWPDTFKDVTITDVLAVRQEFIRAGLVVTLLDCSRLTWEQNYKPSFTNLRLINTEPEDTGWDLYGGVVPSFLRLSDRVIYRGDKETMQLYFKKYDEPEGFRAKRRYKKKVKS